ncbi:hypothetical protein SAMD00019534_025660 [Acytostelium subglobosum LB1]|uniref:hypothetical protein n=1 Tax=Acytostelium subglobosum LB1 TaxID=1410327 RepID=UPI0006448080|nr:hypothetical protein SAMD00019534_025660 [Acytostelium subglobosum LB1]GAM19391.1 hypothetical protein SAMD00019534_025660 [Acytostelium subglobosum LB1]|eukprot:XP_012757318.1 hypothetical protein SAMD00019534_025660 [Acytostelium subglobosum LB1]
MSLFTASRKPKQIRKKTTSSSSSSFDNDDDKVVNSNNNNNNDIDNVVETQPMIIEPIIQSTNNQQLNNDDDDESQRKRAQRTKVAQRQQQSSGKKKVATTTTLLSFGEDHDDNDDNDITSTTSTTTTTTTPVYSLENKTLGTIKRNDFSITSTATTYSTHMPSSGEYTKERLNILKKEQTAASAAAAAATSSSTTTNGDIDDTMIIDIDRMDDDQDGVGGGSIIPTREQIKAALDKRRRLQEGSRDGDDNDQHSNGFIPLSSSSTTTHSTKNGDSNSSSNKISFGDPGKDSNKLNKIDDSQYSKNVIIGGSRSTMNNDDDEEEEEEDEELTRWQFEQIKKGGGIKESVTLDSQIRKHQQDLLNTPPPQQQQSIVNIINKDIDIGGNGGVSFIESLCKDMELSLDRLSDVYNSHRSELSRVEHALQLAQEQTTTLESRQHVNDDELSYFTEFETYIKNMTDCLEEKVPLIESYEERLMELERDHSAALRKQINDYIHDLESQIDFGQQQQQQQQDMQVDEFGRDRSYFETASREKRMAHVREKRMAKKESRMDEQVNGSEDDDEQELYDSDEESYYMNERNKALSLIRQVLDDVDEEYSTISMVRDKFQHWKIKDYRSYKRINIGYIIPYIFAPFLRLQLIDWNPLKSVNFDTLQWYTDLMDYGIVPNLTLDQDDPDPDLIPKLVIKVIIPKVEYYITYIWNPLSQEQSKHLKETIDEIHVYVENKEELQALYTQIYVSLKNSSDVITIPITDKDSDDIKEFTTMMFTRCIRLVKAVSVWSGKLDNALFTQLLLDDIINRKLLPYLGLVAMNNPDKSLNLWSQLVQAMESIQLNNNNAASKLNNAIHMLKELRNMSFNNDKNKQLQCENLANQLLIKVGQQH